MTIMKNYFGIKAFALALMIIAAIFLTGCTQSIADIKNQDHVGKKVMVSGTVEGVLKIGELSGYTIKDSAGETIRVSSETLPKEGSSKTVSGMLMKDSLFGYYIIYWGKIKWVKQIYQVG